MERPIKVTAVINNIPEQSHFHADFLVSMSSNPESRSTEWLRSDFNTYVLMRKGADYKRPRRNSLSCCVTIAETRCRLN